MPVRRSAPLGGAGRGGSITRRAPLGNATRFQCDDFSPLKSAPPPRPSADPWAAFRQGRGASQAVHLGPDLLRTDAGLGPQHHEMIKQIRALADHRRAVAGPAQRRFVQALGSPFESVDQPRLGVGDLPSIYGNRNQLANLKSGH